MSSTDVTPKEIRISRFYYVLSAIVQATIPAAFIGLGVWFVLEFIDSFILDSAGFYDLGIWSPVALVIAFIVVFVPGVLWIRLGMPRKKGPWQALVEKAEIEQEKQDLSAPAAAAVGLGAAGSLMQRSDDEGIKTAGTVLNTAGGIIAITTLWAYLNEVMENISAVAAVLGFSLPKRKGYVLATILIPALLIVGIYIPHFVDLLDVRQSSLEMATETIERLSVALEKGCSRVSFDDPSESYRSYGYYVFGYLDEDESISVTIKVESDEGLVESISYHSNVDVTRSKEEILSLVQSDIDALRAMVLEANVDTEANVFGPSELPDDFVQEFLEASLYEEDWHVTVKDNDMSIMASYHCSDSEENFDEHSSAYINLYVFAS